MSYSSLFICLIVLCTINNVFCSSFVNCPDISKAEELVYDIEKQEHGTFGKTTLDFRLPESGLFAKQITCIVITDLSTDGSGGDVSIVNGGVGTRTVEIRIVAKLFQGLNYRVEIYSAS